MSDTASADATEAEPTEADLRAVLRSRTDPLRALQQGLELLLPGAGVGAVALLVYAGSATLAAGAGKVWAADLMANGASEGLGTVLFGVVLLLAVYTAIQFTKRETATLVSWVPSLFLVPCLTAYGAIQSVGVRSIPVEMIVPSFASISTTLIVETFIGAVAMFVWIRLGDAAHQNRAADLPSLFADLRARWVDVSVIHGTRFHAILIGMQVVIPGIFYALQLAFADLIAVLDPTRPALRRSGQLTFGMRGRIFRMFLVVFLLNWGLATAAVNAIDQPEGGFVEVATEAIINPDSPSLLAIFAARLIGGFAAWVSGLALLVLYREREAQVTAKRALRALVSTDQAAEPAPA